MRDPRTKQEVIARNKYERVYSILVRRYGVESTME